MASKRVLYQPAPKTNVGQKKTRRPLIQGRLVTDGGSFETKKHPHLAQGELADPTLSPMKIVPVLTEQSSPRPEPPSQCLDLSDTDLEGSLISESRRGHSVMVFDASHLGSSSHGNEVEVIVGYEDSPARVVCHTPKQLERSMQSTRSREHRVDGASTPCNTHWTVSVDKVPRVGSTSKSSADDLRRNLFSASEDQEEVQEYRGEVMEDINFSRHSRGIIEEILAHEVGRDNVDVISLHSQSSPSPKNTTGRGLFSGASKMSQLSSSAEIAHSSPSNAYSEGENNSDSLFKIPSYPQQKFDKDPASSTDSMCVKGDASPTVQFQINDSDSETCSLNEYVKGNKGSREKKGYSVDRKHVKSRLAQTETVSSHSGNVPPKSRKKKQGREIQSRYLQNASATSLNTLPSFSKSKSSSSESSSKPKKLDGGGSSKQEDESRKLKSKPLKSARVPQSAPNVHANTKTSGSKLMGAQHSRKEKSVHLGPGSASNNLLSSVQQAQEESPTTLIQAGDFSDVDNEQVNRKTSTPTRDQLHQLSQSIDASVIQSVSSMSLNVGNGAYQISEDEVWGLKPHAKKSVVERDVNSEQKAPSQLELSLAYTKYLQGQFLLSKVKKMFKDQERQAMTQLHGLSKLVEKKRAETSRLDEEVARLKRINLVDGLLERTERELPPLNAGLPRLDADCSRLSSALDATLHQLPTKDVYFPRGGDEEREAYQDKMEETLRESHQLLSQLSGLTGEKMLPISQYLASLEAVDKNLTATDECLRNSLLDLDVVQDLSMRLTSLNVQKMQAS